MDFPPSALILWWSRRAPAGSAVNAGGLAFVARSCPGAVLSWVSDDATVTSSSASWFDESAGIKQFATASAAQPVLDAAVELIDQGFELIWSSLEPGWAVHYVAIGGVTAHAGTAVSPTESLRQRGNGVGFRPDVVFVVPTAAHGVRSLDRGVLVGFGAASPGAQVACGFLSPDAAPPGAVAGAQRTDCVLVVPDLAGRESRARVASFDDDGFTLEWSRLPQQPQRFMFLALGGLRCAVGTSSAPRRAARRRVGGFGFRPNGVLCFGWGLPAAAESKRIGRFFLGAATSATSASATSWGDRNIDEPQTATQVHDSEHDVLLVADTRTKELHSSAALRSFDARGFTLDWTHHDGRARQLLYAALGDRHPAGFGSRALRVVWRLRRDGRSGLSARRVGA